MQNCGPHLHRSVSPAPKLEPCGEDRIKVASRGGEGQAHHGGGDEAVHGNGVLGLLHGHQAGTNPKERRIYVIDRR